MHCFEQSCVLLLCSCTLTIYIHDNYIQLGNYIPYTVDLENFGVKNFRIAQTSTKLKHTGVLFTMKILLSNNYYHASSIYSRHWCSLNVSNKNVHKAQTFTSFYYGTGGWRYGSTPMDGLPDREGL